MENYLQGVLLYLRIHPFAGELFAFFVAFLESLPVIGTIIPGTVTMTVVGILIGTDALPCIKTLIIVSLAAFAGDCIGFAAGYWYNERIRTVWPFRKYPKWLAMGEAFFKKHGGKSIVIGRFFGPARSTVPLIAGLLQLSWLRFCIAAIPSAALWAVMYTGPGIILGALSRELPKGESTRFFLYGLLVIALIWLVFWLIQHFFIQLVRMINKITDRCWSYLSHKNGGRFFIRLITNQQNPSDHHQLTLFLTAAISAILFLIVFFDVRLHEGLTHWNYPIFHLLQTIRTPFFNTLFVVVSIMGMPVTLIMISLLLTTGLFIKKQWRTAAHLLSGLVLSSGAVFIFKKLSHSTRPQGFEIITNDSSFPSGHTTLSFTIFGLIAFFAAQIMPKKLRWIPYALATMITITVAVSRLYLGAHWFTDIIGAALLALPVVLVCIISYRRMPSLHGALRLKPLFSSVLLLMSLMIPWAISLPLHFKKECYGSTPTWVKQQITLKDWWKFPQRYTPLYRNNRLGDPFQPFNVQWQGSINHITRVLESHGWTPIPSGSKLKSTLQRLSSIQAQYHTALLPWLYHDKPPALFLIKHLPSRKRIIELRLWESNIHLQPGNKPLWLGATDILIPPKKAMSLKGRTTISLENNAGLTQLHSDTVHFLRKYVTISQNDRPEKIHALKWDGKILLIRDLRQ